MRETEVEEYEGQGEEGELEASCNIVSVRSWRGVRARGGAFCTEPAHRDTGRDHRGAQWQPPRNHAIPTSLAGQQCQTNP